MTVNAVGPDGNSVEVTVLLNAASELITESTRSEITPPDNAEAVAYLRGRLDLLANPPSARPFELEEQPYGFE